MANNLHGVFLFSKERAFWTNSLTSYNKAIKISETSNCRTSYAFVDVICNRTPQVENWFLSYVRKVKQTI